jgi:uncharacterized membrane protein YfcA
MSLLLLICLQIYFFLVSILFAMLGIGGGAIYTPLQLFVGVSFHTAAANSLLVILLGSLSASWVYFKNRKINWGVVFFLLIFSGLGASIGGFLSGQISEKYLSLLFTITLMVISKMMLQGDISKTTIERTAFDHRTRVITPSVAVFVLCPAAFSAGLLGALLGVGGGALLVPLMLLVCKLPMDIAVGSSTFLITLTALLALPGHIEHEHLVLSQALPLAAVTLLGGLVGAKLSLKTEQQKLRTAFAAVLVVVSLAVFARAFLLH